MFALFEKSMDALNIDFSQVKTVAVAVSGGADSLTLAGLLREWAVSRDVDAHVLTVDHGLRPAAADEALAVGAIVGDWPRFSHAVLKWENPTDRAVQEEARRARYGMMAEYCVEHGIAHLFLGHHRDDQAETVLFRLAKGSGLDGLCGMRSVSAYNEDLSLVRPLLGVDKADLIAFCHAHNLDFVNDPSNENADFARVRLREAADILAREGLSAKRLSVTADRLLRAKDALDEIALSAFQDAVKVNDSRRIVFNVGVLRAFPEEIVLRVLLKALKSLRADADYAPRMERVEVILADFLNRDAAFRKRTLGGVVFERDDGAGEFLMYREDS